MKRNSFKEELINYILEKENEYDPCSSSLHLIDYIEIWIREFFNTQNIDHLEHDMVTVGCTDEQWCTKCRDEDHVIKANRSLCPGTSLYGKNDSYLLK